MTMEEKRFLDLADDAFQRVLAAFDDVDTDDADLDVHGDVIAFRFRDGAKIVLNVQRPTRQLWLAGDATAWHFDFDDATGRWAESKGELFATLAAFARRHADLEVRFGGTPR